MTEEQRQIKDLQRRLKEAEDRNRLWEIYTDVLLQEETDPQKKRFYELLLQGKKPDFPSP